MMFGVQCQFGIPVQLILCETATTKKLSVEYSLANREVKKNLQKDKRMYYENLASQSSQAAIREKQSELY